MFRTLWVLAGVIASFLALGSAEVIHSGPTNSYCNTSIVFLVDESGSIGDGKPNIMQQVYLTAQQLLQDNTMSEFTDPLTQITRGYEWSTNIEVVHYAARNIEGNFARVMVNATADVNDVELAAYAEEARLGSDPAAMENGVAVGGVNRMSWFNAYGCTSIPCVPSTATSAALDWTRDQINAEQENSGSRILILITDGISMEPCAHLPGVPPSIETLLQPGEGSCVIRSAQLWKELGWQVKVVGLTGSHSSDCSDTARPLGDITRYGQEPESFVTQPNRTTSPAVLVPVDVAGTAEVDPSYGTFAPTTARRTRRAAPPAAAHSEEAFVGSHPLYNEYTLEKMTKRMRRQTTDHQISWGFNISGASIEIEIGDTVTWLWDQDASNHNVVSGVPGVLPTGVLFQSPLQSSGNFTVQFNQSGVFPYFCQPHFFLMVGTIQVNTPPTLPPTPFSAPTESPSVPPTTAPTSNPSTSPTSNPSGSPTTAPSGSPTTTPSGSPTATLSESPTINPSASPTTIPSTSPTATPSGSPTANPSTAPSVSPTGSPTAVPSVSPTATPSRSPTAIPSASPTTLAPTSPTAAPTAFPTLGNNFQRTDGCSFYRWVKMMQSMTHPADAGYWGLDLFTEYPDGSQQGCVGEYSPVSDNLDRFALSAQALASGINLAGSVALLSDGNVTYTGSTTINVPGCQGWFGSSALYTDNTDQVGVNFLIFRNQQEFTAEAFPSELLYDGFFELNLASSLLNVTREVILSNHNDWCPVTTAPTAVPTAGPTLSPSANPTVGPTVSPTAIPTDAPTVNPTETPTASPTTIPTVAPTAVPSENPTSAPTSLPTLNPTGAPTDSPTANPTESPTERPTPGPTHFPTLNPTAVPTESPTAGPTWSPTEHPTPNPTRFPTATPTSAPTSIPTTQPTDAPTTAQPTTTPTAAPTDTPTTRAPSFAPTAQPTGCGILDCCERDGDSRVSDVAVAGVAVCPYTLMVNGVGSIVTFRAWERQGSACSVDVRTRSGTATLATFSIAALDPGTDHTFPFAQGGDFDVWVTGPCNYTIGVVCRNTELCYRHPWQHHYPNGSSPGPNGAPGNKGVAGAPGNNGVDGVDGAFGEKGDKGQAGVEDGLDGAPGAVGDLGALGEKGYKGNTGQVGPRGDTGEPDSAAYANGQKGDRGPNGTPGLPGTPGSAGGIGVDGSKGMKGASPCQNIGPVQNGTAGARVIFLVDQSGSISEEAMSFITQTIYTVSRDIFDGGVVSTVFKTGRWLADHAPSNVSASQGVIVGCDTRANVSIRNFDVSLYKQVPLTDSGFVADVTPLQSWYKEHIFCFDQNNVSVRGNESPLASTIDDPASRRYIPRTYAEYLSVSQNGAFDSVLSNPGLPEIDDGPSPPGVPFQPRSSSSLAGYSPRREFIDLRCPDGRAPEVYPRAGFNPTTGARNPYSAGTDTGTSLRLLFEEYGNQTATDDGFSVIVMITDGITLEDCPTNAANRNRSRCYINSEVQASLLAAAGWRLSMVAYVGETFVTLTQENLEHLKTLTNPVSDAEWLPDAAIFGANFTGPCNAATVRMDGSTGCSLQNVWIPAPGVQQTLLLVDTTATTPDDLARAARAEILVSLYSSFVTQCAATMTIPEPCPVADGVPGQDGQTGENGLGGSVGDAGERGVDGLSGIPGSDGAGGAKGDKGSQGAGGLNGDKGTAGTVGLPGDAGSRGPDGLAGAKGPQGELGFAGLDGADTANGAQGPEGDKGDLGPAALRGAIGLDGDKGQKGQGGLVGGPGIRGARGPLGEPAPCCEDGEPGADGLKGHAGVKGPKGASLKGQMGDPGSEGAKGDVGPQGSQGSKGISGAASVCFDAAKHTEYVTKSAEFANILQNRTAEKLQICAEANNYNFLISQEMQLLVADRNEIDTDHRINATSLIDSAIAQITEWRALFNTIFNRTWELSDERHQNLTLAIHRCANTGRKGHVNVGAPGERGTDGAPGARGEDGLDGTDGTAGSKGPRGDAGMSGIPGGPGTKGLLGDPGDRGVKGPQRENGLPGPKGANGDLGSNGAKGLRGVPGTNGNKGLDGPDGARGPAGEIGAPGLDGLIVDGNPGTDGVGGNPGFAGEKGAKGVAGVDGVAGIPGTDGTPGAKGQRGVDGAGVVAPDGERGLVGAAGPKGLMGADGSQGAAGAAGSKGPGGDPGRNGEDALAALGGDKGVKGSAGVAIPGPQGLKGHRGLHGLLGEPGYTGIPGDGGNPGGVGIPGTPGTNGTDGANGARGASGDTGDAAPAAGPHGNKGTIGDTGIVGSEGSAGPSGDAGSHGRCIATAEYNSSCFLLELHAARTSDALIEAHASMDDVYDYLLRIRATNWYAYTGKWCALEAEVHFILQSMASLYTDKLAELATFHQRLSTQFNRVERTVCYHCRDTLLIWEEGSSPRQLAMCDNRVDWTVPQAPFPVTLTGLPDVASNFTCAYQSPVYGNPLYRAPT